MSPGIGRHDLAGESALGEDVVEIGDERRRGLADPRPVDATIWHDHTAGRAPADVVLVESVRRHRKVERTATLQLDDQWVSSSCLGPARVGSDKPDIACNP